VKRLSWSWDFCEAPPAYPGYLSTFTPIITGHYLDGDLFGLKGKVLLDLNLPNLPENYP
jgi:hypothetical protein